MAIITIPKNNFNKKRRRARHRDKLNSLNKKKVKITINGHAMYYIFSDKLSGYLQIDGGFGAKRTAKKIKGSEMYYTIGNIFYFNSDKAIRLVKVK